MLARADTINRRRDRTWGQALPADDPRLPQLLRDAALESIEVLAGTFAEMRHEAHGFTAARCRPDCTEFLEAVPDAGQPAAQDEAKVELRLGFIQRHTGRGAADILRDLEDATWALLASEWPAVEAVAEALDQKSHLEGLTALGIWSASRLPLGQRDDAAGAVSPSGMRVLTELAEAVEPDAGTPLPWCR